MTEACSAWSETAHGALQRVAAVPVGPPLPEDDHGDGGGRGGPREIRRV